MLIDVYAYVHQNFFLMYKYSLGKFNFDYFPRERNGRILVPSLGSSFFDLSNVKSYPLDKVVFAEWMGIKIPLLFPDQNYVEVVTISESNAVIHFDIIASIFYFLSGWDELSGSIDSLGRQVYAKSVVKELGIAKLPIVNYYFDILNYTIENVYGIKRLQHYGNHSFTTHITHDIDKCESGWLEGCVSYIKRMQLWNCIVLSIKRLYGLDPWFNMDEVIDFDLKYQAKATFFFLAKKGRYRSLRNADYNVSSAKYQNSIKQLVEAGHDVGIHGSFGSHMSARQLMLEVDKLNALVYGNRFHFLMFDLFQSPSVMETSRILYDSSLGFPDFIGFRRGTCYPFYLFDFLNNKVSKVVEFPLIVMDSTLISPKYMGLELSRVGQELQPVILEIQKFNGFFTILWHNTMFSEVKYGGMRNVLEEILDYCLLNNSRFTSLKDSWSEIMGK
ncbi:MAG: polysaccharide deacetylase family protein [Bacteroidales bacterium]|nr:polysaccharide deacetylase family protein [Bacteroidales bacterium]